MSDTTHSHTDTTHPYAEQGHALKKGPRNRGLTVGISLLVALLTLMLAFWLFGEAAVETGIDTAPAEGAATVPAASD